MNQLKLLLIVLSITICFTSFAQISVNTQDPNNAPFMGTWEYIDGDQIFRLFLFEDTQPLFLNRYSVLGHYEMVEVDPVTGQEQVLYTSNHPPLPERVGAFFGLYNSSNSIGGQFHEFHTTGVRGTAEIKIEPSCTTCPKKIKWKLEPAEGMLVYYIGDPVPTRNFEVPTDIILEKAN